MSTQDERRDIYEVLAREYCGEFVAVTFHPNLYSHGGTKCDGLAVWSGRKRQGQFYYEAQIQEGLPLDREAYVAAHEIAHIKAKHPRQIAPTYARHMIAAERTTNKAYTGPKQVDLQEWYADVMGKMLLVNWRINQQIKW